MKVIYYGFGGFIGFVCGLIIHLILYWVEQSGYRIVSNLGNQYGMLGRWMAEMVELIPYFGVVFGLLIVKILFEKELDSPENTD